MTAFSRQNAGVRTKTARWLHPTPLLQLGMGPTPRDDDLGQCGTSQIASTGTIKFGQVDPMPALEVRAFLLPQATLRGEMLS